MSAPNTSYFVPETMLNLSDEAVARLFNMGFSTEDSTKALKLHNFDFEKALDYLIKVKISNYKFIMFSYLIL